MLKKIEDNLNKRKSTWLDQLSLKQSTPKSDLPKAAVLIAITDEENPEIIYTLRSNKVSSHQGEVSFPGGMKEESDTSLTMTALRESEEEIGLPQKCVKILGSLDTMVSRFNVSVTPFVGVIPGDIELNTSSEEIEACFKEPVSFLRTRGQFLFFRQWKSLRDYAYEKGGRLIGDLLIFLLLMTVRISGLFPSGLI